MFQTAKITTCVDIHNMPVMETYQTPVRDHFRQLESSKNATIREIGKHSLKALKNARTREHGPLVQWLRPWTWKNLGASTSGKFDYKSYYEGNKEAILEHTADQILTALQSGRLSPDELQTWFKSIKGDLNEIYLKPLCEKIVTKMMQPPSPDLFRLTPHKFTLLKIVTELNFHDLAFTFIVHTRCLHMDVKPQFEEWLLKQEEIITHLRNHLTGNAVSMKGKISPSILSERILDAIYTKDFLSSQFQDASQISLDLIFDLFKNIALSTLWQGSDPLFLCLNQTIKILDQLDLKEIPNCPEAFDRSASPLQLFTLLISLIVLMETDREKLRFKIPTDMAERFVDSFFKKFQHNALTILGSEMFLTAFSELTYSTPWKKEESYQRIISYILDSKSLTQIEKYLILKNQPRELNRELRFMLANCPTRSKQVQEIVSVYTHSLNVQEPPQLQNYVAACTFLDQVIVESHH